MDSLTQHMKLLLGEVLSWKTTSELRHDFTAQLEELDPPRSMAAELQPQTQQILNVHVADDFRQSMQELSEAVEMLETEVSDAESNHKEFESKLTLICKTVEKCTANLDVFGKHLEIPNPKCIAVENKIRALEKKIESINAPVEVAYKGTFVWKILNFRFKLWQAVTGIQLFLDSNAFYTDQYGYKMNLRIYLDGSEEVRATHLSLYIRLLKGEFDALLDWPFQRQVSFILKLELSINRG
nr:PREDICTED: TNF receptor-associated factor 1-like [Latimeria chalumnae]|eukprot:XP_014346160.1 PREDICTED: TNF receptor-associated factor 1-like [Latimeria chalumnae]